jgi:hypothetical protein
VPEDADTDSGTPLYAVHAQDADDGLNGQVSYKIMDGKPAYGLEAFRVHPSTGIVTLHKPLDHEKQTKYDLTIIASDLGTPALSAYLQLRIDVQVTILVLHVPLLIQYGTPNCVLTFFFSSSILFCVV